MTPPVETLDGINAVNDLKTCHERVARLEAEFVTMKATIDMLASESLEQRMARQAREAEAARVAASVARTPLVEARAAHAALLAAASSLGAEAARLTRERSRLAEPLAAHQARALTLTDAIAAATTANERAQFRDELAAVTNEIRVLREGDWANASFLDQIDTADLKPLPGRREPLSGRPGITGLDRKIADTHAAIEEKEREIASSQQRITALEANPSPW